MRCLQLVYAYCASSGHFTAYGPDVGGNIEAWSPWSPGANPVGQERSRSQCSGLCTSCGRRAGVSTWAEACAQTQRARSFSNEYL
jgi:hypothetical protein